MNFKKICFAFLGALTLCADLPATDTGLEELKHIDHLTIRNYNNPLLKESLKSKLIRRLSAQDTSTTPEEYFEPIPFETHFQQVMAQSLSPIGFWGFQDSRSQATLSRAHEFARMLKENSFTKMVLRDQSLTQTSLPTSALTLPPERLETLMHGRMILIGEGLSGNTIVTYLDLSGNSFGSGGALPVAKALTTNRTLRTLILDRNNIDSSVLGAFSEALLQNTSLTRLAMVNNNLGLADQTRDDTRMGTFLSCVLVQNSTLKILDFSDNHLSGGTATALEKVLPLATSLRSLRLEDNDFTSEHLKQIARGLEGNTSLTELKLTAPRRPCPF